MKTTSKAVVAAVLVLFIFTRCSQMNKEKVAPSEKTGKTIDAPVSQSLKLETEPETTANMPTLKSPPNPAGLHELSSSAAVEDGKDSVHQFIRTADVKFKVDNVANATYKIEDIAHQLHGYVSYTNLASTVDSKTQIPVSADSALQTTYYTVQNTMVIRVPNTNLDSTLKALTPLVAYLDFRVIKANDASLQLFTNKLKQQRIAKYGDRVSHAIDGNNKKLSETANAEDGMLDKQEMSDNAKIDNLQLADQVKYSTINLSLYQPRVIERTLVYNDKNIRPYEPGLLTQLAEAAQFGFSLFEELLVVFVRLWPLVIIGILVLVGYRKWKLKAV